LDLHGLGQQRARALPQDFGELIVKASWLNKFGNVIVGHGISLLQWRSGGVKHPHDMPPFLFAPPPTFSDISLIRQQFAAPSLPNYQLHRRSRLAPRPAPILPANARDSRSAQQ